MAKKHEQNEAVNTEEVVTSEVVTSATEQVAEVEPTVEMTVETPVVEPVAEPVVEETKVVEPEVVIPEPEIIAEEPKIVVTPPVITAQGTVIETRFKSLPGTERRYRLVHEPPMYPRGRQRAITLELLRKHAPIGSDRDMSAVQVVKEANAMGYSATAEHVLSIAWHLNQMLILGQVECTSGRISMQVERGVTPAEAETINRAIAKPLSLDEAISKGLIVLTPDQIAAMQLAK